MATRISMIDVISIFLILLIINFYLLILPQNKKIMQYVIKKRRLGIALSLYGRPA